MGVELDQVGTVDQVPDATAVGRSSGLVVFGFDAGCDGTW